MMSSACQATNPEVGVTDVHVRAFSEEVDFLSVITGIRQKILSSWYVHTHTGVRVLKVVPW